MIKDRVFQKRIKGKVLAMAMTAVMTSLFVPLTAGAAQGDASSKHTVSNFKANLVLANNKQIGWHWDGETGTAAENCYDANGVCQGHKIMASGSGGYGIKVEKGANHRVILSKTTIATNNTAQIGAIELEDSATLTLVLDGESTLTSAAGYAGIHVPSSANLTIQSANGQDASGNEKDKLSVKSLHGAAGIGGAGYSGPNATAGTITIDGGMILAEGGNTGAGIGGAGSGKTTAIKINGGTVIAKGGDGKPDEPKGTPGIGSVNGGQVTINGGKVIAVGGDDYNSTTHASGISGNSLTALNGGNTVIISDAFDRNLATTGFNGLVWDINRNADGKVIDSKGNLITVIDSNQNSNTDMEKLAAILDKSNQDEYGNHGHTCTVYGKATMPADFPDDFGKDDTLVIGSGTQFLIPVDGPTLTNEGKIIGSGTLINPDKLVNAGGTFSKDIDLIVSFDPKQDLTLKDLTYTGESFADRPDVFEYKTQRLVDGDYIPVDRTGLTYTIEKTDNPDYDMAANGVKDAGTYNLEFTYGTSKYPIEVVVKQRDLADEGIQVEPIPGKDYIGRAFTSGDFENGDVVVKYNGNQLKTQDYSFTPDPTREDAGTASMTITAKADGNFMGERKTSFTINKVAIDEAEVTLRGGGAESVVYNGESHKPDVDTIKLTVEDKNGTDGKSVLTVTDYEKKYSTDDFINAGKITIEITTDKSKNFTGSCEKTFEIKPRQLIVQSITAESRSFDGTAKVRITDVDVDLASDGENSDSAHILSGDFKRIGEPTELTGFVASGGQPVEVAVVGPTYDQVVLKDDMCLSGEKGRNYTLAGLYEKSNIQPSPDPDGKPKGPNALLEPVIISQREAPEIKLTGEPIPDEAARAFGCKLTVAGIKEGVDVIDKDSTIHYYMSDGEADVPDKGNLEMWKHGTLENLVWDAVISPNSDRVFYAFIEGSPNVKESEVVQCHVAFGKLPRSEAPSSCTLSAVLNEDGETYTLIVEPEQETTLGQPDGVYRYSFDPEGKAETYTYSNRMDNAEPNTEYTAWIKFAADEIYEESTEGTPASIKTDSSEAKKPEITCNGVTQTEGEIPFYGTADVSIDYTGKLAGMDVYYTTDNSTPTASSTKYNGTFTIDKDKTTVKAIAIKAGVATSAVTSVELTKAGEADDPNNPGGNQPSGTEEVIPVIKALDDSTIQNSPLGNTEFNTMDAVTQQMASKILLKKGYTNSQMIYCDLTVQIRRENGQYTDATEEDFAKAGTKGIRVGLAFEGLRAFGLPAEVNGEKYNFAVSHMFSTDIPRLSVTAGQTEEPTVSKTADGKGIAFYVTGTSPLAIAWADIASSDPNPVEDPDNPNNPDDPNNPTDPDNPNNPDDPNNPVNPDDSNNNQPGDGDQNGSDGTTSQTDTEKQGVSDDSKNALSNIMPKTGDPLSFVPWIAAAVISIGVIASIMKKKSGKKNTDKKKKTTTAAKKTTQKTKKKK